MTNLSTNQYTATKQASIKIDTWARSRIGHVGKSALFVDDKIKDGNRLGESSEIQSHRLRTQPNEKDIATEHGIGYWKESAMNFLKVIREEDMPVPVQLKQIIERPSTGEQKMRAIKEQQIMKDRLKLIELKMKQETMEKERKIIKTNKGALTYDFEGKTMEVKQSNAQKVISITTSIPY
jgi:hypothetical protein